MDGIHFNARPEDDRLCMPEVIGARIDGTKERDMAESRWRRLNGRHQHARVRAGACFRNGLELKPTIQTVEDEAA